MSTETNIPKFTKEQQRANLIKGIAALRRNKKKAKGRMRDSDGGRCCLCVLANSAERICGVKKGTFEGRGFPKIQLGSIFGITNTNTWNDLLIHGKNASYWNDGRGNVPEKTHKEIARMLKAEYLK